MGATELSSDNTILILLVIVGVLVFINHSDRYYVAEKHVH